MVKISVVTDEYGKVLGTAPLQSAEGEPVVQLVAGQGQTVREVELTMELEEMGSAQVLHEALERQLGQR